MSKAVEERERVIIRFAGDSGDGMQLAGSRFTDATAVVGNDLATLPNFPAEIRAPAGTLAGVSAFQIHFASRDILTPGDAPNVLVAMNPAALKANLSELERGATIIVNEDAFTQRNLEKAGYRVEPARGRVARGLPGPPDPDDGADDDGCRGDGGRLDPRRRPRQEPVRARRDLVAVRAAGGRHRALDRAEVREASRRRPGEPRGVQRRLVVRRDDRAARRPVPRRAGDRRRARDLPERQRDDRAVAGADRGVGPVRAAAGARVVSDHAGVRAAARALASRGARRHDDPGRGRDRGGRDGARAPRSAAGSGSPRRAAPGWT